MMSGRKARVSDAIVWKSRYSSSEISWYKKRTTAFPEASQYDHNQALQGLLAHPTPDCAHAPTHAQIHIQESKLNLLHRKLKLTRLPTSSSSSEDNGVTADFMRHIIQFWLTKYGWRVKEA